MTELSIVIPFCNEYPQIMFTIQSVAQSLVGRADFEILAVDNFCDEVRAQGREEDKGGEAVKAAARGNGWLKYLKYEEKLSHWQAKNLGVEHAQGDFLWFTDGHTVPSRDAVWSMLQYYRGHHEQLNGTLHLPLTYKILEWHRLIYKLNAKPETGEFHYSFTTYRNPAERLLLVPCMSTCGMMMTRGIYDDLGGWPRELGIYGGGENFVNFTLAVLGKGVWIWPQGTLFHHGEKRGYAWNYSDHLRNRAIATYCFGGQALLDRFMDHAKGRPNAKEAIKQSVLDTCSPHRAQVKARQKYKIEYWAVDWIGSQAIEMPWRDAARGGRNAKIQTPKGAVDGLAAQ